MKTRQRTAQREQRRRRAQGRAHVPSGQPGVRRRRGSGRLRRRPCRSGTKEVRRQLEARATPNPDGEGAAKASPGAGDEVFTMKARRGQRQIRRNEGMARTRRHCRAATRGRWLGDVLDGGDEDGQIPPGSGEAEESMKTRRRRSSDPSPSDRLRRRRRGSESKVYHQQCEHMHHQSRAYEQQAEYCQM